MLEQFIEMLKQADYITSFNIKDLVINQDTEVTVVTVDTDEVGNAVEAVFHKGTGALVDMNVIHTCHCHNH